ncbi:hypothetical protein D3C84_548910 [compost metagenome]
MLREQGIGNDVTAKKVVYRHESVDTVQRHSEKKPLMLHCPNEALVPRALCVTQDAAQLVELNSGGS